MIALVSDSNSQLPLALADRYAVALVPLTVTIDGIPYLEGVDLTADEFYARFTDGAKPEVSTSQPSPGQFADAYADAAAGGATEILSIHIDARMSGTLNAARLASLGASVPVRLVDTATASFGVACCVWVAAEALAAGKSAAEAAAAAEQLAPFIGSVFTVGALDLVAAGGRLRAASSGEGPPDRGSAKGVSVLTMAEGEIVPVATVHGIEDAADAMARHGVDWAIRHNREMRVAIGVADPSARDLSDALRSRLAGDEHFGEIIDYRIGPSVGAHTGPGTAGAFFFPS